VQRKTALHLVRLSQVRSAGQYGGLSTDWPVLHRELCHWKVVDIRGGQARTNPDGRSGNEAVRLVKRDTSAGEVTPPSAGTDPFRDSQRRKPQCVAQTSSHGFVFRAKASPDLLHRDRAEPRLSAYAPQPGQPRGRRTTTHGIDKYRGVQQHARHVQPARRMSP
jgi:hypothetical protein